MSYVKYFMWKWQQIFCIAVDQDAKSIFDVLDPALHPRVFLIGVPSVSDRTSTFVGLEPDDCGYEPSAFALVEADAALIEREDPDRYIMHDDPGIEAQHHGRLKNKALQQALQAAVRQDDEVRGVMSFCSWPMLVQQHRISLVLQFDREAYRSHYALAEKEIDFGRKYSLPTSFLDTVLQEYFKACAIILSFNVPYEGLSELGRDAADVLLKAGRNFMTTPGLINRDLMASRELYDAMNEVAALRYERAEGNGKILLSQREHPSIERVLTLATPVPLTDRRGVRKLLQLTTENMSLLSDAKNIFGLGRLRSPYDVSLENIFTIRFLHHHVWELLHGEQVLMRVSYGQPRLPRPPLEEGKFTEAVKRFFRQADQANINELWTLVQEAIRQERGALIVLSPNAANEAQRLRSQAMPITPTHLTPELIQVMTSIDGAVLMDVSGVCHAIGVILDGLVTPRGNPGRGSRYNSAVFYAETYPGSLIVVVSEDGTVDLVPNLRPQISRTMLEDAVQSLREMIDASAITIKDFNTVMGWLDRHRFYLSPAQCEEINTLFPEIQDRHDRGSTIRILWPVFDPNEEMGETYFLDE